MKPIPKLKIAALGGCGGMGAIAIQTLLKNDHFFDEITVVDIDFDRANHFVQRCNDQRLHAKQMDITDKKALYNLLKPIDIVINTVGPYYRLGLPVLKTAIDAKCNYIDLNDDWKPTVDMLSLDSEAKQAGITAVIGVGASPGISNMLAVKAMNRLDEVENLITGWGSGGKRLPYLFWANQASSGGSYGAAIDHLLKQLTGKICIRKDNQFQDCTPFQKQSIHYPESGLIHAYTVGHPEPVTLPRFRPEIRNSINVMNLPDFLIKTLQWTVSQIQDGQLTHTTGAELLTKIESDLKVIFLNAKGRQFAMNMIQNGLNISNQLLWRTLRDIIYPGTYLPELFAIAKGIKEGQPLTVYSRLTSGIAGNSGLETMAALTGVPLAVGLSIIANHNCKKGVLTPEMAFHPDIFFDRLAPLCHPKRNSKDDLLKIDT